MIHTAQDSLGWQLLLHKFGNPFRLLFWVSVKMRNVWSPDHFGNQPCIGRIGERK